MPNPATRRAERERRRRLRLRDERETNQPPPTAAEALATLDARRAEIAAALDAALEKAQAQTEAALAVPLDPALRALILESLLVEHRHHSGDEPMACALWWIDAVLRIITAHAALRGITMTTVPTLLSRALLDYRAGSSVALDAMIDNKPAGKGSRALPTAAHERALIAAWVTILQGGGAKSGAYSRAAAIALVIEELARVGIHRTADAVRRNHQAVALDRKDSPDALQLYDTGLAALPEEAATWPRDRRQRWLRRRVENAAGTVFRS